jgi:hypothetical protein
MSRFEFFPSARLVSIAAVLFTAILWTGCGNPSNNSISNAQAQAISQEFVSAVQSAMTSGFASGAAVTARAHESLAKIIRQARPETSPGCPANSNGWTCNFPVSYTGPCPSGGTISVSGDFDMTLNDSGDGSDSSTLTVRPSNCVLSNLTINGDPSVMLAATIILANNALSYPVTMTENGGISYGPHPAGRCTVNVSLVFGATSCRVSGNVCGHSVSGNC